MEQKFRRISRKRKTDLVWAKSVRVEAPFRGIDSEKQKKKKKPELDF